jgi:hypothetical protein
LGLPRIHRFGDDLEETIKRSPNQFSPNRPPMDRFGASYRFQTRLFKALKCENVPDKEGS